MLRCRMGFHPAPSFITACDSHDARMAGHHAARPRRHHGCAYTSNDAYLGISSFITVIEKARESPSLGNGTNSMSPYTTLPFLSRSTKASLACWYMVSAVRDVRRSSPVKFVVSSDLLVFNDPIENVH